MAVVAVQCPECGSPEVVKYGQQPNGEQRYRCNNPSYQRRIFLLRYRNTGWMPEVKQQMVEMALNGSGIRDTARVSAFAGFTPTAGGPITGIWIRNSLWSASGGRNSWNATISRCARGLNAW